MAAAGLAVGTVGITLAGSLFNAFYLIPAFSRLYGIPLDAIVGMGTAINPAIDSVSMLVLCVGRTAESVKRCIDFCADYGII